MWGADPHPPPQTSTPGAGKRLMGWTTGQLYALQGSTFNALTTPPPLPGAEHPRTPTPRSPLEWSRAVLTAQGDPRTHVTRRPTSCSGGVRVGGDAVGRGCPTTQGWTFMAPTCSIAPFPSSAVKGEI